jgi:hypothetical protein
VQCERPAKYQAEEEPFMTAKKSAEPQSILQLKITLKGSKRPIWRRIQVANTITLPALHNILQAAMGWTDSHLHQFIVRNVMYSDPDFELEQITDEKRVSLPQLKLEVGMKFQYEYDFGDDWMHDILVEKILPPEPGVHYPRWVAGKRACPPEDCGGIWGYDSLLETIADPDDPNYEEMREWLPEGFDPAAFDMEDINRLLRTLN